MLKRLNDFLAGLPMTIVAGVFLLLDLLPRVAGWGWFPELPFSPAWVTVVISGIPMVYLALWRVVHNPGISKISSALLISVAMAAAVAIGDIFAAGEVAFIMAIGAILEDATTNRAQKGLKKLVSLAPTMGRLRPEARQAVDRLREMGVQTVLLSGDDRRNVDDLSSRGGVGRGVPELLPEQKVQQIEALQREGRRVCMIGDGVNDAPALKTADVGAAMGSDIAVEAADTALMTEDLSRMPYLKRLSSATVATIKFSITLSMCINFLAIVLSLLGLLNPTTGALVHYAGSCFVVLIAALLYDRRFD